MTWLGLLLSFHAYASSPLAPSCAARLEAAVLFALAERPEGSIDEVLARLDRDLVDWSAAALASLPPGRRENFLSVLEGVRFGTHLDPAPADPDLFMDQSAALLVADARGLRLIVDAYESGSEGGRFALRHELGHLRRFVVDGSPSDCARRAQFLIHDRPLGVLREEAYAAREDYRYLRRNYGRADDARLRARVLEMPACTARAVARGILRDDDEGGLLVDPDALASEADRDCLRDVMKLEADARLLALLRQAWTMTEAEYVKAHAARYLDEQREIDAGR